MLVLTLRRWRGVARLDNGDEDGGGDREGDEMGIGPILGLSP